MIKNTTCIVCNKEFVAKRDSQKCCSRSCNAKNHNKVLSQKFVVNKCKVCGQPTRRQSVAIYCSKVCFAKDHSGENATNWNGGRRKHPEGYIYLLKPEHPNAEKNGYVLEHRLIMSELLGRPLTKKEVVHHKNDIKNDNRPENLELLTSQVEHLKKEGHLNGRKFKVTFEETTVLVKSEELLETPVKQDNQQPSL